MYKFLILAMTVLTMFSACQRDNILTQDQWGPIFKKYGIDSACFELADNNHDMIYIYNLQRASKRFSPASTFKIMSSLIALETNVALDENLIIPWDGVARRPEWDKDMNLREAFKVSCVPYYQALARKIGKVDMQKWIDTVRYGNKRTGPNVDDFWLNDTLQITPDEQVGFIKKLYFDKLPFAQRSQRIVRSLMLQEDSTHYKLYYKTGTQMPLRNNKKVILAWIVGFVEKRETQIGVVTKKEETNYKPYFFAMNFETSDTTMNTMDIRKKLLKDILAERRIIIHD
ncbi:MAG: class D beta-lactamase [Bacteroidetes bacterium]|jgi:beta-lactamase class D|nr:class D beta-lactamase [Bacteroidota bacterium]MBK7587768.1 class D beta-lactamase [Bacteroidota bacterium]MBK9302167.1 class D beta-lactamase [Bacteroidota bacterium]